MRLIVAPALLDHKAETHTESPQLNNILLSW